MSQVQVYDNSQLQAFKNCPESYRLKYIENLHKREGEGVQGHHKEFGSAIHAALETYYKGGSQAEALAVFEKAYPDQMDPEDMAKTTQGGRVLLEAYFRHYEREDREDETLAVEVVDTFEIAPGVAFTVKIDRILRKQGCVYWMDHKTTGKSFNWMYWGQFEPNSQASAYTAYVQSKYGECSGGIINALRFGHRQRAYKGEPAGFYQEFQRQITNRNAGQIEAWKADQVEWIREMQSQRSMKPLGSSWRKNEGACMWCAFKEVCISVNDEQIIEQLYEKGDAQAYLSGEERELSA